MSRLLTPSLIVLAAVTTSEAGTKPLIELVVGESAYQGRVEILSDSTVTLLQRDGRITEVDRQQIKKFRKVADRFRPYRPEEIAEQLGDELGKGYRVQRLQHYLVATPKASRTNYGAIFENVYGSFHYQLRRRSIPLNRPEFPLVAIVFSDFKEFAAYARQDGVLASPGLLGYYHRLTNRVAVYETPRSASRSDSKNPAKASTVIDGNVVLRTGGSAGLADTITHETMHQVGFNTGVHPRIGHVPKWIIEGLATTFEAPGFLTRSSSGKQGTRLNRERFVWFRNYMKTRRKKGSLKTFIESDGLFRTSALDAYSEAWALTFFFMNQPARSYRYRQYLNKLNARADAAEGYSKADRVADFESAFGEISHVEMEFLRYMKKLDPNAMASR